ncbi:hypothetical protein E4K67_07715 [Desulfosporosinus fructosivorans]|uniref:Dinitrogenase iron-molybdenum cofactor biosynthesis domain-containing protein n=1 Tax=Desulfosporosinus fructosivorans TaxID=2018669 RepID=A0A4Z0RBD9_9FIRM|nr:NifB/NifX family molybdenum-iron cluster-binding protein [Desulfosporosinus fructosivorans]TGE39313.1 hypothetical protein E4K67_07715 [Desulfosporosinus fructosivorans]
MKIAIATNGDSLKSLVAEEYENSSFLLVVETDDLSFEVYKNAGCREGSELKITRKIIERGCEALICGSIEQADFEPITQAQVTRYYGAHYSVKDALNLMENYQLDIIREYKGGEGLAHQHDHLTCNCDDHEE